MRHRARTEPGRLQVVGSSSEVALAFDFRQDTPAEVLAAFSALKRRFPEASWFQPDPPPALPDPVQELVEFWEPDWRDAGYDDEFAAQPWRHDWAAWLSSSMSVGMSRAGFDGDLKSRTPSPERGSVDASSTYVPA